MEELMYWAVALHWVFVTAMILLAGVNLFFLYRHDAFVTFSKKVQFVAPQYYMTMAALFFTGLIALAVVNFSMSLEVILMIVAWFFIFVFSMKGYKLYKRTHKDDIEQTQRYKKFAKIKYQSDIGILFLISLFSYVN